MLLNDSDADNNTLTVSIHGCSGPMHGNVTIQPGRGVLCRTPTFTSTDEFSYEVYNRQPGRIRPASH